MLGNEYSIFRHGKSEDYVIRSMNYSLPSALHGHVAVVAPTTYFGTMKSMRATSHVNFDAPTVESDANIAHLLTSPKSLATVPSSCSTTITPACLRALYNTSTYVPAATDVNILGVAGYLDEFANRADLQVNHLPLTSRCAILSDGEVDPVIDLLPPLPDRCGWLLVHYYSAQRWRR